MLKRVSGNLLALAEAGEFDVIVHGCNCFNTMGSGIARQIREKYPTAFAADVTMDIGIHKLGSYSIAPSSTVKGEVKFAIVNAYTQFDYNRTNEKQDLFEYASFEIILKKLAYQFGNARFGLPMIGMGLAGGAPDIIIPMIEDFAAKVAAKGGSVTLVEYVP